MNNYYENASKKRENLWVDMHFPALHCSSICPEAGILTYPEIKPQQIFLFSPRSFQVEQSHKVNNFSAFLTTISLPSCQFSFPLKWIFRPSWSQSDNPQTKFTCIWISAATKKRSGLSAFDVCKDGCPTFTALICIHDHRSNVSHVFPERDENECFHYPLPSNYQWERTGDIW